VNLSSEYPIWLIIPALLLSALVSYALYKGFPVKFDKKERTKNILLAVFRAGAILMILLLLLNPLFRVFSVRIEKPTLILALDQSKSMVASKDSSMVKKDFFKNWTQLADQLSEEYRVQMIKLGSEAQLLERFEPAFTAGETDLSALFSYIRSSYDQSNIGAVVLATDGIYNKGNDPVSDAGELNIPVYTLGLGDTMERKDIVVYKIRHNETVLLGNLFPVEIEVASQGFAGRQATLTLERDGKSLFTRQISFSEDGVPIKIQMDLNADKVGVNHYRVNVSSLPGELTLQNNSRDFFVDVLDGKQKVLLCYHAPHPDIAALKNALESEKNTEITTLTAAEAGKLSHPEKYSLIIYHQIPSAMNSMGQFIRNAQSLKIPALYILGSQSQLTTLNMQQNLVNISSGNVSGNESVPFVNPSFGLFTIPPDEADKMNNWPPLAAPFGNYITSSNTDVLFYQQVGYVKTDMPLIVFNKAAEMRTGVICGEGIWKWRMNDFSQHDNTKLFDGLVRKMVQFLSLKEDKRPFKLSGNQKYFLENEKIYFDAELRNESFELVNSSEVSADLSDEKGRKYHYIFTKTSNAYHLDAGLFPPGNYMLHAYTNLNSRPYTLDAKIAVLPLQNELTRLTANVDLLRNLSAISGGQFFPAEQITKVKEALQKNERIRPIRHQEKQTHDLIYYKWVFLIILVFWTVEWGVRKIQGAV
jgi:hypothetical protein